MAGNYYHQRLTNPWIKHCMENPELVYQQTLLSSSPVHRQFLYHNLHLQHRELQQRELQHRGLNHALGRHCQFGNSIANSSGSPHSISSNESHDSNALNSAFLPHRIGGQPPTTCRTIPPANAYRPVTHQPEQPIDLSKRKSQSTSNETRPPTSSRLADLLSRKRKGSKSCVDSSDQSAPLNLSKRTCLPTAKCISSSQNGPIIVDMNDAVNNPVELVQLLNQSQAAEKITRFLNQMMCKIFALESFNDLHEADRTSLVLNCWHRLLLWIYAENKFAFKVTSVTDAQKFHCKPSAKTKSSRINHPSMAFVKSIATFLKKYETLNIDSEEMSLLFALTLFHSAGDEAHEEPEKIGRHTKSLLSQLQSYVKKKKCEGGEKRYVDLLMYLPMLYGVNGKMVEELFCQHLSADGDIKIILKETIKNYSSNAQTHRST